MNKLIRKFKNLFRNKYEKQLCNQIINNNIPYVIINKKTNKRVNTHIYDYNSKTEYLCVRRDYIIYFSQAMTIRGYRHITLSFSSRSTIIDDDEEFEEIGAL